MTLANGYVPAAASGPDQSYVGINNTVAAA